jgi:hypothetical protein
VVGISFPNFLYKYFTPNHVKTATAKNRILLHNVVLNQAICKYLTTNPVTILLIHKAKKSHVKKNISAIIKIIPKIIQKLHKLIFIVYIIKL